MDRRWYGASACVLLHGDGVPQLCLMQSGDTARGACCEMFFSAFLYLQIYTVERKSQRRGEIQTQSLTQQGGLTWRF